MLSGNSANEILFGVECPDDGLLSPNLNPIDPSASRRGRSTYFHSVYASPEWQVSTALSYSNISEVKAVSLSAALS